MQVKLQNERKISLGVWDTAGAERFQSISRMYYHGSRAAVICFYPGNQQSFAKAKFWVSSTQRDKHSYVWLQPLMLHCQNTF